MKKKYVTKGFKKANKEIFFEKFALFVQVLGSIATYLKYLL